MKIILKPCYSLFCKDYRIIKLIFIVFTSFLIFLEFYTYIEVKPTYTYNMRRKLAPEDFPEILLCPEPSMDVGALNSKGYDGIGEYFHGLSGVWETFIGWSGNKSEDVSEVIREISTLKRINDCQLKKSLILSGDLTGGGDSYILI